MTAKIEREIKRKLTNMRTSIGVVDRKVGIIGKLDASGNTSANALEGLPDGYVWVRIKQTGQAIRALNDQVQPIPGVEVFIIKTEYVEEWMVEGLTPKGIRDLGIYAASVAVPAVQSSMNNSILSPVNLDYLRPKLPGNLLIEITSGFYVQADGTVEKFSNQVVDLSAHQPAGPDEKTLALIGIDANGSLTTSAGSPVSTAAPPYQNLLFSDNAVKLLTNASNVDVLWLYAASIKDSDTDLTDIKRVRPLWIMPRHHGAYVKFTGPTAVEIASGAVNAGSSRFLTVDGEGSVNDDLDTINDVGQGEEIVLIAASGVTITVKHGTDNIETDSGADISLSGNKVLKLLSIDGSTLRQYA